MHSKLMAMCSVDDVSSYYTYVGLNVGEIGCPTVILLTIVAYWDICDMSHGTTLQLFLIIFGF